MNNLSKKVPLKFNALNKLELKTFIDLFSGAGGLSEGFIRAGFTPVSHIEMNREASLTLETRSAYHYLKSINKIDVYNSYLKGEITRIDFLKN